MTTLLLRIRYHIEAAGPKTTVETCVSFFSREAIELERGYGIKKEVLLQPP